MNKKVLKIPDGAMILPDGRYYSLNSIQTRLNNNVLICGTSGSSKTRNYIIPNLLECVGSYIVTDPKGTLYEKYGKYLERQGYRVLRLSFIHPEKSVHYNPLYYIHSTQDIQKLAHSIINADKNAAAKDPFWDEMSVFLINSIIGYLKEIEEEQPQVCNITTVMEILRICGRQDLNSKNNKFSMLMENHREKHLDSWAAKQYQNMSQAPNKTYDTIVATALSKFSVFDTEELHEMLSYDEIDFASIGQKRTALFCEISDTDRSMDTIVNMFFTQAINTLCTYADEECDDYSLSCPVRFFLDDFCTNAKIEGFERMISNIRSRKISAVIVVQSLSQLKAGYGENYNTIIDNCDTLIFTGTNSPETAEQIAIRCNKTMDTILHMPLNHSWIFRRGSKPFLTENYDLDEYIKKRHRLLYLLDKDRKEKLKE